MDIANSGDIFTLVVIGLMVIAVPIIYYFVNESAKRDFAKTLSNLKRKGFVIEHWRQQNGGDVTVCWGRLAKPVPVYLRVSNRDQIELIAAKLGIKDIKTGDDVFDSKFVVRSNHPDLAKEILSDDTRKTFLTFNNINFLTGSLDSALSADHWPEQRTDRKSRDVWMVRTSKKLSDKDAMPYLSFDRDLMTKIQDRCKKLRHMEAADYETAAFEGR